MRLIIYSIILFSFINCKKDNRTEIKKIGDYRQETTYIKGNLSLVKTYTLDNNLVSEFKYKNNLIFEIRDFYPNGKDKIISKLIKEPNHYLEKAYYENGKLEYEGEMDFINGKKYRRSWWIFYRKTGSVNSLVEFINDGKKEVVNQKIVRDSINNKADNEKSFYFKNNIIETNVDSIKLNIEYISPNKRSLDKTLYIIDNEGKELGKYFSSNYKWIISVKNNNPLIIKSTLKSIDGKNRVYNIFQK